MDVNLALGISTAGNRLGGFANIPRSTANLSLVEPEFEPQIHWKETPETYILVANLPGFTTEDVRVHIDKWGNLIISGERRVEEWVMVEGRMQRMERLGGQRFRKIFGFPAQNLNAEGVTAKFEHETLYVWLPKVKAKSSTDKRESIELPDEEKPEAKHYEQSEAISSDTGSAYESESREETVPQEDEGSSPESWRPSREDNLQPYGDYKNPEEQNQNVPVKGGENFGTAEVNSDYPEEDAGSTLPSPPERFQNISSCTSFFSKRRVRIASAVVVASTVVILSVGFYLSYKLSSSSTEDCAQIHDSEGI